MHCIFNGLANYKPVVLVTEEVCGHGDCCYGQYENVAMAEQTFVLGSFHTGCVQAGLYIYL